MIENALLVNFWRCAVCWTMCVGLTEDSALNELARHIRHEHGYKRFDDART